MLIHADDSKEHVPKGKAQQNIMALPADGKPEKTFSGKLPFRTKPEVHERIYLAAKQSGLSINAWMEAATDKVAKEQLEQGSDLQIADPSQLLQRLLGGRTSAIFDLVDQCKSRLKSQKTSASFEFIGAIEKLLLGWETVQHLLNPQEISTVSDLVRSVNPLLNHQDSEEALQFFEAIAKLAAGLAAIRACLKNDDANETLEIAENVISFLKDTEPDSSD